MLKLEVRSADEFGVFLETGESLIRLTALPDYTPHPHPVFGWNVSDISAVATDLKARGVSFTIYEGMGQDDLGVWTAPDGRAKVVWVPDPYGNVLSLSQA